jgi:hypothetical protein
MAQAVGSDGQIDALGPAASVFLVWLALPAALLLGWLRRLWITIAAPLVVVAAAMAFTMWSVRPQAPNGADWPETYSQGATAIEARVRAALADAAPDRRIDEPTRLDPERCVDGFGRDRSAVYNAIDLRLDGQLTQAQFDRVASLLSQPRLDVEGDRYGRRAVRDGQQTKRYVVRVEDGFAYSRSTVEIVTPCLRVG